MRIFLGGNEACVSLSKRLRGGARSGGRELSTYPSRHGLDTTCNDAKSTQNAPTVEQARLRCLIARRSDGRFSDCFAIKDVYLVHATSTEILTRTERFESQ
jgi:hypothetical protein